MSNRLTRQFTDADHYCRACKDRTGRFVALGDRSLIFRCYRCRAKWGRYIKVTDANRDQHGIDVAAMKMRRKMSKALALVASGKATS